MRHGKKKKVKLKWHEVTIGYATIKIELKDERAYIRSNN